jgi:hypothetical protein
MWMSESRIKEEKQRAERLSANINSYGSYIEIAHPAGLQDEPGTHCDIYFDRLTSVTRRPVYRPHSVEIIVSGREDSQ